MTDPPPRRAAPACSVELDLDVYTFDIDFAGHVSNITYLRWLEIARLRLLEDIGTPTDELLAEGLAPVLVRTEIDYRSPLVLGDPVHVSLWLTELRAASATLAFEVTSRARVAATAVQRGLFVDVGSGKPRRLAPPIRDRLVDYLAPSAADADR